MTSFNATENGNPDPQRNATRPPKPRPSMILATIVATIATISAYLAMVKFGLNVLEMDTPTAYATAGVFELLLVTIAILAREAAKDGRPYGVLLMLTWLMSSGSGYFAAWDELYLNHPWAAAAWRFLVPLLAALGWHLALIGDRHLSTGISWTFRRQLTRMQRFYESVEAGFRAGDTGNDRKMRRAQRRLIRARSAARRVVTPDQMRAHAQQWTDSDAATVVMAEAARDGHNRLGNALLGTGNATPNATQPALIAEPDNATRIDNATEPGNRTERQDSNGTGTDDDNGTGSPLQVATVSNVRPLPTRDNATEPSQPAPVLTTQATQPETAKPQAPAETQRNAALAATERYCLGCGEKLPAHATARAKYCIKIRPDGRRDQTCKNRYNAAKPNAARDVLERAVNPGNATAFA